MPKNNDENYQQYRDRLMNPISSTFCSAKWYNATIWLGSGTTTSCHHPPAQRIPLHELEKNPSAIHNTPHKKQMRKLMLDGERPSECEYCWKIEDMDRDAASDRIFKTVRYTDEENQALQEMPWDYDVDLKTLEIAFDRICNFACSYCNASFSTVWGNDITSNGPYKNLISDGGGAFKQDGKWAEPYGKNNDGNPYIKAFWDWWPKLKESLMELRITGGEPTMSPHFWKLVELLEGGEARPDMNFSINSNLIMKDKLLNRLIASSHNIPRFGLYTSCEAWGKQAEYLRDGLHYDQWLENFDRVHREGKFINTNVMMTITGLCLFSLTDFLDDMMKLKERHGWQCATISTNILRFPSFMSPLALPDHIREDRRQNLQQWLDKNGDHEHLKEMEIQGLVRLVDYLDVVKTPHSNTSELDKLHHDFKSFYTQYDERRGKSFGNTFPEIIVDWYNSIPEN